MSLFTRLIHSAQPTDNQTVLCCQRPRVSIMYILKYLHNNLVRFIYQLLLFFHVRLEQTCHNHECGTLLQKLWTPTVSSFGQTGLLWKALCEILLNFSEFTFSVNRKKSLVLYLHICKYLKGSSLSIDRSLTHSIQQL